MSVTIKEDKLLFEGREVDHIQIEGGDYYNKYIISAYCKANKIGHQEYISKSKAISKYQEYKIVLNSNKKAN